MTKINWKVRIKNPLFIVQIILAIFLPILAYLGLTVQDLVSWPILGENTLKSHFKPLRIGVGSNFCI